MPADGTTAASEPNAGMATGTPSTPAAGSVPLPVGGDILVAVRDLRFDLQNPRAPNEAFETEEDAARYLLEEYNVEELVQSILSSGWIDYEPLIAEVGSNVVYEGNRRLAALRLIGSTDLREHLNYALPAIANPQPIPEMVRVRPVPNRAAARRYIAFKHITGPLKWDAFAKAKYASAWLDEGEDIEVVSKMLGDNHNTIRRLVAGYKVLEQAKSSGFDVDDRTKKRFSFSHLYTAVSRPAVRQFLGLDEEDNGLSASPVPAAKVDNLRTLMSWLYGQEKRREPTIIASQNPNLNQLVRVMENETALAVLVSTRRLDQAFEAVEPPSTRFKDALIIASKHCESALGLSSHYDGDPTILEMAKNLAITVRNLRDAVLKRALQAGDDL
jgi:hypothetical protein